MNRELVSILIQLVIGCAVIMTLIAIACIITPKIAARINKRFHSSGESPARVEDDNRIPTQKMIERYNDA